MTTPAKKPFDAESHRFGMAYETHSGKVGYLIDWSHSMGFHLKNTDRKDFIIPRKNKLYRSPEHDLIPRQDVDALIEALEYSRENTFRIGGEVGSTRAETEVKRLCREQHLRCDTALSEFQSKHGGRDE